MGACPFRDRNQTGPAASSVTGLTAGVPTAGVPRRPETGYHAAVSLAHLPIDPARVVELLERERAEGDGAVIATDADGTLWSGDVGEDLFEALLAAGGVRAAAQEALVAEAVAFDLPTKGDGNALARALYEAFQKARYPLDRAFSMMAWAFAGWTRAELAAFVADVVVRAGLAARLRPELAHVLRFCEERGIPVYVVSASPIAIVTAGAALAGIHAERVIAMQPLIAGDCVAPALGGPLVYGEGKLTALRAVCPAPILGAFGDSSYDAPMLRAARVPVAVHPSKGLLELASTIPGLVVVGRA